jgi:hypothetical protein
MSEAFRNSECIYCGSTTPPQGREHVIPQAFGMFENNWTLDCVCDECNSYFAKELDLPFARDSAEAHLRLHHGLKPATAASQLLNRRAKMTVVDHDFLDGANVILRADKAGEQVLPFPFPQVGFRKGDAPWIFIPEERLTHETVAQFKGESAVEVRLVGNDDFNPERLVARLGELGIRFVQAGRVQGGIDERWTIENEFTLDDRILRAIGKISFNYCAKVIGADFIRHESFDAFRRFVRFGETPNWEPVSFPAKRALNTEPGQDTKAHWCVVSWAGSVRALVVQLCLFNQHSYQAILCSEYKGEHRGIAIGHLFDPFTKQITQLPFLDV